MTETIFRPRSKPAARSTVAVARAGHERAGLTPYEPIDFPASRPDVLASIVGSIKGLSTAMLSQAIAHVVGFCTRQIWPILLAAAVLAVACGGYAARHFSINADVTKLIVK